MHKHGEKKQLTKNCIRINIKKFHRICVSKIYINVQHGDEYESRHLKYLYQLTINYNLSL